VSHPIVSALNLLDARSLIESFGTVGIAVVLFAETGLLVGFFLPGDSLLFTAGLLCATSTSTVHLSLPATLLSAALGALAGAQVGYWLGRRAGRSLLAERHRHLQQAAFRAEELLRRYGYGRAIVFARFIPVVRTVLNPLAGIVGVPTRVFARWQVAGGLLWTVGITLAGYALGQHVHNIDHYLLPIIGAIVVVSLLPLLIELIRGRYTAPSAEPGPS
jgi:membrane-associated protein